MPCFYCGLMYFSVHIKPIRQGTQAGGDEPGILFRDACGRSKFCFSLLHYSIPKVYQGPLEFNMAALSTYLPKIKEASVYKKIIETRVWYRQELIYR